MSRGHRVGGTQYSKVQGGCSIWKSARSIPLNGQLENIEQDTDTHTDKIVSFATPPPIFGVGHKK